MDKLHLIKIDLLEEYLSIVKNIQPKFDALKDAEVSTSTFSFYTSVASVFSSKIEGEEIELDSYIKHKAMGMAFKVDYTKKIDDLYSAYIFAKNHGLTSENLSKAHTLLAKNLLGNSNLGKLRSQNMYVVTDEGQIEYVAASPYLLEREMKKWWYDVRQLLTINLSTEEVFYYAAYLHLTFVKIHPWYDGNGRTGRLIEKWFVAEKLGGKAWFLQSEKNYYQHHALYYHSLRLLGLEYEQLDYSKSLPFLLMLPQIIMNNK